MGNQVVIPSMGNWYIDPLKRNGIIVRSILESGTFFLTLDCVDEKRNSIIVKAYESDIPIENNNIAHSCQIYDTLLRESTLGFNGISIYERVIIKQNFAFICRRKHQFTLSQRLEEYPPLEPIEKLWITYRILNLVNYLHECNLFHGAINPDNIYVNWDLEVNLGDMAPFKPSHIKSTRPDMFHHFFATVSRSCCYLAPEQLLFPERTTDNVFFGLGAFSMDFFAAGLVIYYLYTGDHLFAFSQLIQYSTGQIDITDKIKALPHEVRNLVSSLLCLDPDNRLIHFDQMTSYFPPIFPQIESQFAEFFHSEMGLEHLIKLIPIFQMIIEKSSTDVRLIFINVFTSFLNGSKMVQEKVVFVSFICDYTIPLSDKVKLGRVLPVFCGLLSMPSNILKADALSCIVKLVKSLKEIPIEFTMLFDSYLIPIIVKSGNGATLQYRCAMASTCPILAVEIERLQPEVAAHAMEMVNFIIKENEDIVVGAFVNTMKSLSEPEEEHISGEPIEVVMQQMKDLTDICEPEEEAPKLREDKSENSPSFDVVETEEEERLENMNQEAKESHISEQNNEQLKSDEQTYQQTEDAHEVDAVNLDEPAPDLEESLNNEMIPTQIEESPQPTEESPQQTEESPQQTEESPQQAEESPQQAEESPQQTEESPQQAEESPQQIELSPETVSSTPSERTAQLTEGDTVKEVMQEEGQDEDQNEDMPLDDDQSAFLVKAENRRISILQENDDIHSPKRNTKARTIVNEDGHDEPELEIITTKEEVEEQATSPNNNQTLPSLMRVPPDQTIHEVEADELGYFNDLNESMNPSSPFTQPNLSTTNSKSLRRGAGRRQQQGHQRHDDAMQSEFLSCLQAPANKGSIPSGKYIHRCSFKTFEHFSTVLLSCLNSSCTTFKVNILHIFRTFFDNASLNERCYFRRLYMAIAPLLLGFLGDESSNSMIEGYLEFILWFVQRNLLNKAHVPELFLRISKYRRCDVPTFRYFAEKIVEHLPKEFDAEYDTTFICQILFPQKLRRVPTQHRREQKQASIKSSPLLIKGGISITPKFLKSIRISKSPITHIAPHFNGNLRAVIADAGGNIYTVTSNEQIKLKTNKLKKIVAMTELRHTSLTLLVDNTNRLCFTDWARNRSYVTKTRFSSRPIKAMSKEANLVYFLNQNGTLYLYDCRQYKPMSSIKFDTSVTPTSLTAWNQCVTLGVGFKEGMVNIVDSRMMMVVKSVLTDSVTGLAPVQRNCCNFVVASPDKIGCYDAYLGKSELSLMLESSHVVPYDGNAVIAGENDVYYIDCENFENSCILGDYHETQNLGIGVMKNIEFKRDISGYGSLHKHSSRITVVDHSRELFMSGDVNGFVNFWALSD